jgi:hypothetical protein
LQAGHRIGAEPWRRECIDLVVVIPAEEDIVLIESVVDANVEAVRGLRLVGADDVVIGQCTDAAGIRSGIKR